MAPSPPHPSPTYLFGTCEPLDPGFAPAAPLVAGGMAEARSADLIAWVRARY